MHLRGARWPPLWGILTCLPGHLEGLRATIVHRTHPFCSGQPGLTLESKLLAVLVKTPLGKKAASLDPGQPEDLLSECT